MSRILTLHDSKQEEPDEDRVVIIGFGGFDYNKEFWPLIDGFKRNWSYSNPARSVSYERDFLSPESSGPRVHPEFVERTADAEGNVIYKSSIARVSEGEPSEAGGEAVIEVMYANLPHPLLHWIGKYRLYGDAIRRDGGLDAYENPRNYPIGLVTAWNDEAAMQIAREMLRMGILDKARLVAARNEKEGFMLDVRLEDLVRRKRPSRGS